MTNDPKRQLRDKQVIQWLEKLQQESWQLELLVSAFTIFLLVGASHEYEEFYTGLRMTYSIEGFTALIYVFLGLVAISIKALIIFLVIHLLLRGFWIGSIGLRSVQSTIDFSKLKYSEYFTEKLKNRVTSLDDLVILLDEVCSVIFSFSFLVISIILSFGLYVIFFGVLAAVLGTLAGLASGSVGSVISVLLVAVFLIVVISGLVYLIDYFTLGFFKKFSRLSKIYFPIYRFYGFITLAVISRSIYYYMISKFSKRRIRLVYSGMMGLLFLYILVGFDQYQFYPEGDSEFEILSNYYDDTRSTDDYVRRVSIQSKVIDQSYIELFLRYDPQDNASIRRRCPDFEPLKKEGLNPELRLITEGGNFLIQGQNYDDEDKQKLLNCLRSFYQITVNDSIYNDVSHFFFKHPNKKQMGLIAMIPTWKLPEGENLLEVRKIIFNASDSISTPQDFAYVPFWKVE